MDRDYVQRKRGVRRPDVGLTNGGRRAVAGHVSYTRSSAAAAAEVAAAAGNTCVVKVRCLECGWIYGTLERPRAS